MVLHLLDERVDGLLRELVPGEAVGLVDEEHAADRLGADLGRLHRGLPDVPGDELAAVDLDELALGEQPERLVDRADEPSDRRLPGARVANEDQVPAHPRRLEPGLDAHLLDLEQGNLPVDLLLDPVEPDHRVELGEQLLDRLLRLGRCRLSFRGRCLR